MRPLCTPCAGTVGMRIASKKPVVKRALAVLLGMAFAISRALHATLIKSFRYVFSFEQTWRFSIPRLPMSH
jgi:hypothetical protein